MYSILERQTKAKGHFENVLHANNFITHFSKKKKIQFLQTIYIIIYIQNNITYFV